MAIVGGGIAAVGSIGGSLIGSGAQEDAAKSAAQVQLDMFNTAQGNLAPYMQTGAAANANLQNLTGNSPGGNPLTSPLLSPIKIDEQTLQTTPGYQFNLQQGLKSVQNSAAARGLGVSGAAEKGAANYATGLADSTYQNQFNNALTNQSNQFSRLLGLTQLGQTSAAGLSSIGATTGQGVANSLISGGNAAAAGALGVGNAVSSAYPNYLANNALAGLYGGNNFNSAPADNPAGIQ